MGNYGIRISAEGEDVKTCDDLDTIVNSKYSNLKGSDSGSGSKSVPTDGAYYTVTIAHGLDHIPMVQGFCKESTGSVYTVMPSYNFVDGGTYIYQVYWGIAADATNVYLEFQYEVLLGTVPTKTINYKYCIYNDKGNLN